MTRWPEMPADVAPVPGRCREERDMTDAATKSDDQEPDYRKAMLYHSDRADAYMVERDALQARLTALQAQLAAAEARAEKAEGALVEHNDLLRSTFAIAEREGVKGMVASTNWDAFYNRVAVCLKRHHATTNAARAALPEAKGEK